MDSYVCAIIYYMGFCQLTLPEDIFLDIAAASSLEDCDWSCLLVFLRNGSSRAILSHNTSGISYVDSTPVSSDITKNIKMGYKCCNGNTINEVRKENE
jgi:hypothetical protein